MQDTFFTFRPTRQETGFVFCKPPCVNTCVRSSPVRLHGSRKGTGGRLAAGQQGGSTQGGVVVKEGRLEGHSRQLERRDLAVPAGRRFIFGLASGRRPTPSAVWHFHNRMIFSPVQTELSDSVRLVYDGAKNKIMLHQTPWMFFSH